MTENNIPERIQITLEGRLELAENELTEETTFIIHHLTNKEKFKDKKIQAALSQCVHAVLEEYRKNFSDIPYIQYFKPYITKSLLDEEDLWTIANLDQQYAEYRKLNKSIDYLKSKQSDESVVRRY